MLDDPLEPGEATVVDVVKDALLVVVVSDIVKTDVAVHISGRFWQAVCRQHYL
jgi:membrane protein implicated in regulation of membrane protease activity